MRKAALWLDVYTRRHFLSGNYHNEALVLHEPYHWLPGISSRSSMLMQGAIWSWPRSENYAQGFAAQHHQLHGPGGTKHLARVCGHPVSLLLLSVAHTSERKSLEKQRNAKYNRAEPTVNRVLIGKYLCTCTFLKGCTLLALQRTGWKSTAYPLFIPIKEYYYPFGPESLANA